MVASARHRRLPFEQAWRQTGNGSQNWRLRRL